MKAPQPAFRFAWLCLFVTACSSGESIKYGSVKGTVTRMGAPLADAQVTFVPEKGPVAIAVTDEKGEYVISTSKRGVAAGQVKVAVAAGAEGGDVQIESVPELSNQPKTTEEAQAYLKKASAMQQELNKKAKEKKPTKSLLPTKYKSVDSSNLSLTVKANEMNEFNIPLTD